MKPEAFPQPTWDIPDPPGYPAALESAGSIATPLLAGFGFTFAGLVITNTGDFRYVDCAAFLLVTATVFLIYAVQFGFFARQYSVAPAELEAWWPDLDVEERREQVRNEQWEARGLYRKWSFRFRMTYHLGIVFLLAGLAVALIPKTGANVIDLGGFRLAAVVVAVTAAATELVWIGSIAKERRAGKEWLDSGPAEPSKRKGFMSSLRNRAVQVSPIKAPAMNITLGTAGVLSLAAVLTAWKKGFEFIFGDSGDVPFGVREGVLIATIAAIVVVAAADMLARAIAARRDTTHVVPWSKGWKATWTKPEPSEGDFIVAGMRVAASNPDKVEYLLVKEDQAPSWRVAEEVVLDPPS